MIRRPPNMMRSLLSRCEAAIENLRRCWAAASHAGIYLDRTVSISTGVGFKLTDGGVARFFNGVSISRGVDIHVQAGDLSVGRDSFIGPWTTIVSCDSIQIGENCLIAERVTIRDHDHRIHDGGAVPIRRAGMCTAPIHIGNDVWIAAGAIILKGVALGDGAVVAANAVVRSSVPARAIVAGVPAKVVGYRRESS